jgi:hypothetical protein
MKKTLPNSELDNVVSYMTINMGYYFNIVLPYKDGLAFMASLEKAEAIEQYHGQNLKFADKLENVITNIVSQKDYREAKMFKLLGVQDEESTDT